MKSRSSYFKIILLAVLLTSCQGYKSNPTVSNDGDGLARFENNNIRIDDMLLEKDFIEHIQKNSQGEVNAEGAGGYSVYGSQPWPGGVVPVVFSSQIAKVDQQTFIKTAQKWSPSTGVKFINRTTENVYLYVKNDESGCFAEVGAIQGKNRILNLGKGCWTEGVTLHELGHVLGLMHEHQRPDRNSYIRINLENVDASIQYAFALFGKMNNQTAYDFNSIMHYSQNAFSNNGKVTMTALPPYTAYQNVMGIKKISDNDRKVVAAMYAKTIADGYFYSSP